MIYRVVGLLPAACALALAACAGREVATSVPATGADTEAHQQRSPVPSRARASASPPDPAAITRDARLNGFGPLALGMSIEQAGQAWPGLFNNLPRLAAGACFHANTGGPELTYFGFMFDGGKLVGYGGGNDSIVAPGGCKRGMDEAQVHALYANALQSRPNPFAQGGKLLSLDSSGVAPSRLVFETDALGKVTEWRVGLRPQVGYSQGCEVARG